MSNLILKAYKLLPKLILRIKRLLGGEVQTTTVIINRLNFPIELKSLGLKELFSIASDIELYFNKEIYEDELGAALIVAATINFNWNDKKLLEKYRVSNGKNVVAQVLLAGEMMLLINSIIKISGWKREES